MKKVLGTVLALAIVGAAFAQVSDTADQVVTFGITAFSEITVDGAPSLTLSQFNADGSAYEPVVYTGATYSVATNGTAMKISASLEADMPTGLTLALELDAPTDASSAGSLALSAIAVDLVTGITQLSEFDLVMTYTLSGALDAVVTDSETRTVTFTIVSAGL